MASGTGTFKDWVIVVVDDDRDSREIVNSLLKYAGAVVHSANNGQEGVELTRQIKPHFVITDLAMPIMDGWSLIKLLKADTATANIPIIALTAHAMLGDREKAIAAGCHDYLPKPILPASFLSDLFIMVSNIPELASLIQKKE